jgi:gamma-glutamyl-gamma-aminobutyraldehyde dehydrogenase
MTPDTIEPGSDWHAKAANFRPETRPFIGGNYQDSSATEEFLSINPATRETVARVTVGSLQDVDEAVGAARKGWSGPWGRIGPGSRKALLLRLADLVASSAEELALCDSLEMGKPISAAVMEAQMAAGMFRYYAEAIDKTYGLVAPSGPNTLAFATREPIGVVGIIVPWNFPIINAALKLGPVLAAGNTAVIKPSEVASLSTLLLGRLANEAGLPAGVLNIIAGLGVTAGNALAEHDGVDLVAFTGSTATGASVMGKAAKSIKRVLLECGGKSPNVVFDDGVKMQEIAPTILAEGLWNQGQVCVARSRVIVQRSAKDELLELLTAQIAPLTAGDPLNPRTTCGPIAGERFYDGIRARLERAQRDGARVVCGGGFGHADSAFFIQPTILDNVDQASEAAQVEIFGPVLTIHCFDTEEEAVALANDTQYGLAATAWTKDLNRAVRVSRGIRAGKVKIYGGAPDDENCDMALPTEPLKGSGFGVEFGAQGMASYTALKAVQIVV